MAKYRTSVQIQLDISIAYLRFPALVAPLAQDSAYQFSKRVDATLTICILRAKIIA